MDIAKWLNAIGLGLYETVFREHEIDADVLPDPTESDLEKIGVPPRVAQATAAGDRQTRLECGASPAPEPARSPLPIASRADAERRPISAFDASARSPPCSWASETGSKTMRREGPARIVTWRKHCAAKSPRSAFTAASNHDRGDEVHNAGRLQAPRRTRRR